MFNSFSFPDSTRITYSTRITRRLSQWLAVALLSLGAALPATSAVPMVSPNFLGTTCALQSNGTVLCWGSSYFSDLPLGSAYVPVVIPGIQTATAVSAALTHACAVLTDGSVQCWGFNNGGQLGNGTTSSTKTVVPVRAGEISTATAVAAGSSHTCALLRSGEVQCWGANSLGSLGNGVNMNSPYPLSVKGITTAVAISAGEQHTCALLKSGMVQCWGTNFNGRLGNGNTTHSNVPVTVAGIANATAVVAGAAHTCAILAGGVIQCWGTNFNGQLGNGTTSGSNFPVTVSGITGATSVSPGVTHSCALLAGGTVKCWGENRYGQLGDGTRNESTVPVAMLTLSGAQSVATGGEFTCIVLANSEVQCIGRNSAGQLGDGSVTDSLALVNVLGVNRQGLLNLGGAPVAGLSAQADKVFAWAEKSFPQYFSVAGQNSSSLGGYRYRAYGGGHYLAVNEVGTARLLYLGPLTNNTVADLGSLADFLVQAGP